MHTNYTSFLLIKWCNYLYFGLKDLCWSPRGEIGRHKGLKFNLSALGENLEVEPGKFGESLTANTEPRHSRNVRCRD